MRISPQTETSSKARTLLFLISIALLFGIPTLTSCGSGSHFENGFPNPNPLPLKLTVSPSPVTVPVNSTTTFSASPNPPKGFSLVWSVSPTSGGNITNAGVYTASETAGSCAVVATWIPSNPSAGNRITGSAMVTVLQPVALSSDLTQASGALQVSTTFQNNAVVGEIVPAVKSVDPSGTTQVLSGFSIPVPCTGSNSGCH